MPTQPSPKSQIDSYLKSKDPGLQKIVKELRRLVKEWVPDGREMVNPWGIPGIELNGPLFIINVPTKHVTFGFVRGTALDDPQELLEGTGKGFRHIKLRKLEDVDREGLYELVIAAAELNRSEAVNVMGKLKKKGYG